MPLAPLLFVAMLGSTPPYLEGTPIVTTADSTHACPHCTSNLVVDVLVMYEDDHYCEATAADAWFYLHMEAEFLLAEVADFSADVLRAESDAEHAKNVKRFLILRAETDALLAEFVAAEADPAYRTARQRQVEEMA